GTKIALCLSKSHGLASDTTLRHHKKEHFMIPCLLAAVSTPSSEENNHNISTFLDPDIHPPPLPIRGRTPGNVLMFDGIALETRCHYCSQQNQIMGLCWEHAENVKTEVTDYQVIEDVRRRLLNTSGENNKKVCLGKEATVIALAPYSCLNHYQPVPLVVSATDKTEKWAQLKLWMETFLHNYKTHSFGEALNGPIWSLASDGDSTYCRAKHEICSQSVIQNDSEMGKILSKLSGLNLFTSVNGITWTCDPKHIFKHFSTLLRSKNGVMVCDTNITPVDIILHLSQLPDMTLQKAITLLDPADKQNVPKAVSLIQHLLKLESLPIPSNPADIKKRKAINFFAHFLGCFTLPFIDVNMSLEEQLKSLCKFAHLAVALHRKHGVCSLTGALYIGLTINYQEYYHYYCTFTIN
ncbi:hypothetical protein BDQ17DRAFT_1252608, partial [Cyathus striatus]